MQSITDHLSFDRQRCDALFAQLAGAIDDRDAVCAQSAYTAFLRAMQRHFAMEDAILFPAYERASSSGLEVTHLMRIEHEQMRELLERIAGALHDPQLRGSAAAAADLQTLMQRHNFKEEQILYPLLDRSLQGKAGELLDRIAALPQAPA